MASGNVWAQERLEKDPEGEDEAAVIFFPSAGGHEALSTKVGHIC